MNERDEPCKVMGKQDASPKRISRQNVRGEEMSGQDALRLGMNKKDARAEIESLDASDFLRTESARGAVDFHALRHTFGTWLAQSGVHPKACQEMMRHANIDTTMQLYTHTLLDDKEKAAKALAGVGLRGDPEPNPASTENVA